MVKSRGRKTKVNRANDLVMLLESDRELVGKLVEVDEGLTDNEAEFVDNVGRRVLREGRPMTDKQRKWAYDIAIKMGV